MSSLEKLTPLEKRKASNRAAQRKHRDKKKSHERQLAEKNERLLSEIASLQARIERGEAAQAIKVSDRQTGQAKVDTAEFECVLG